MTTLYISNITDDFLWSKVHDELAGSHEDFISLDTSFQFAPSKESCNITSIYALFEPYYIYPQESIDALQNLIFITDNLATKYGIDEKPTIIITNSLQSSRLGYRLWSGDSNRSTSNILDEMWRIIYRSQYRICDISASCSRKALTDRYSYSNWISRRSPYKLSWTKSLAETISTRVKKKWNIKVLVIDLDNTLWNGAIADVGIEGLQMSPPSLMGQVFLDFQKFIKERQREGIILCISSKNNINEAEQAIKISSVLKWSDFIHHEVSWNRKSEAILRISKSLNIGLSDICFIDDSSFERNEVRQALPDVIVPELPSKTEEWITYLIESGYFIQQNELTENESNKTSMYKARKEVEDLRQSTDSIEKFLEKCEVKIRIGESLETDMPRHRQLIKKTNQFRLKLIQDEPTVLVNKLSYTVEDKFADHGLCGLIYYSVDQKSLNVHCWIMSCRVFTRRVEHKLLSYLCKIADSKDVAITIQYEDTTKNSYLCEFMSKTIDLKQEFKPTVRGENLKMLISQLEEESKYVTLSKR